MIQCISGGSFVRDGLHVLDGTPAHPEEARKNTVAYSILQAHNTSGDPQKLRIRFDAMASHDITYVGIIQTARASGLREFPLEYVLTNCHNSLCAVGGTINEDDHLFGLCAAKKYGGVYVPPHQAVIHQFMREMEAGCGRMILGSDSHTRYGHLGTMAIGEGGPELVKQLLGRTYDIDLPEVVGVMLSGKPRPGVGPQDVALAIIGAVFGNGFVKNRVMEFIGEGVGNLSAEFRSGIDVMTTETTCLSSVWMTDETIADYLRALGRPEAYKPLAPAGIAYYDALVKVDLCSVEPMIALPFHPSNVYTIRQLRENAADILRGVEKKAEEQFGGRVRLPLLDKLENGRLRVDQGVIAGCAGGTFDNLCDAADILSGGSIGVLRCGGRAGQRVPVHPALNPELPEPRGLQARGGAALLCRAHGCTLHRRHGEKRRPSHRRGRTGRDVHEARVPLRRHGLQKPLLFRLRPPAAGDGAALRPEHCRLAGHAGPDAAPAPGGCVAHP